MAQMGSISESRDEMSPALIRQLLDIYTLPDPEIKDGCVEYLLGNGMIRCGPHGYECTAGGNTMVAMLINVPLPIHVWIDPRQREKV